MVASAERVDLVSQRFQRDPHPTLARLCEAGPLVRAKLPLLGRAWLVTRHDAVAALLKDSERFVVDARNAGRGRFDAIRFPVPRLLRRLADNMLGVDDPAHRRLRSRVERAFRRRRVEDLHGAIARLVEAQLGQLATRLAREGRAELLDDFARPLPLAVIGELLGLPEADRPRFLRWARVFSRASSGFGLLRGMPGLVRLSRYLEAEIVRQRRAPGPGLLGALLEADAGEPDPLGDDELLSMVFLLLLAGHETTTHLLAGGVLALLEGPGGWSEAGRRLAADPEPAVEELLRFVCPVQMTKPRYAARDLELAGQPLARGELLMPVLAAANADARVFAEPARLDLARDPNPHLAFGSGVHSCLGIQLARAEARLALARLATRLPGLRLALPPADLRYTGRLGIRALRALPVRAD